MESATFSVRWGRGLGAGAGGRTGLPSYKVLQNLLSLYKIKHLCRNPAFLNNS